MKNKIIVFLSVLSFIIGGFFFNTNTSSAETSSTDYVPNQLIVKFKQNASLSNVQSFHKSVGATVLSKDDKLGFEVVQFSKGTVKEKVKAIKQSRCGICRAELLRSLFWTPNDPYYKNQYGLQKFKLH